MEVGKECFGHQSGDYAQLLQWDMVILITKLVVFLSLTSARPPDEPEIVELGHLVLHDGRAVPQLGAVVLIVARSQGHYRPVRHVAQRDHLERLMTQTQRAPSK